MYFFYKVLIYIHVLSAVCSIGPFFVLIPLLQKLKVTDSEFEQKAYLNVFDISIRLVKHSGHFLVGSGVLLILLGDWPWTTSWIVMTLVVMFSSIFFLARAFTPSLMKFSESGVNKQELVAKLHRGVWLYIGLLMLMLWFMVVKPVWW